MNEQSIQEVYREAAEKKWVYPQLFEALKAMGVERYEVDVLKHQIKYVGAGAALTQGTPAGFQELALGHFDAAKFKTALTRSQKQETNYEQFLKEIAAAGISFYRVDMKPRAVTYHGQDRRNKIVEPVPII